ncbi:MAG: Yip1 family protein [Acidobacteriota bacterium]
MELIPRIQGILLKPKEEWEKIKQQPLSVSDLFMKYVLILVAIPAVAQFIGRGIIGYSVPFVGWVRSGIGNALLHAIIYYVLTVASVYVLGIIINALSSSFDSKPNQEKAMNLAAFSMTPAWVAGIFYIIPPLSVLVLLASLYGIYIFYLGFSSSVMETPKEKVVAYFIVTIIVSIVLYALIGLILGAVFSVGGGLGAI